MAEQVEFAEGLRRLRLCWMRAGREEHIWSKYFLGRHLLKHWSKTQSIIALSSWEAELGAPVKGSVEVIGMSSVLNDVGMDACRAVESDATTAIGSVGRERRGTVMHFDVADPRVQGAQKSGQFT